MNVALGPGQHSTADLPAVAVNWPGRLHNQPSPAGPVTLYRLERQAVLPALRYLRQPRLKPAAHKIQSADAALARLGLSGLDIQTPYTNGISVVLLAIVGADLFLALAVAVAATALLLVDGTGDLCTLAAIGAAPRGRRRMAVNPAGSSAPSAPSSGCWPA